MSLNINQQKGWLPPLEEDPKARDAPFVMDPLLSQTSLGKASQQQPLQQQKPLEQPQVSSQQPWSSQQKPFGTTNVDAQMPSSSMQQPQQQTRPTMKDTASMPMGASSSSSSSGSSSTTSVNLSRASGRTIEDLMLFFARCPVEHNHPRPIIGHMHMHRAGPVLTVQQDEHMTRVFAKLVSEGFLSAPVLDEHRKFIGFVDMLAITTYTVGLFEKEQLDWNQSNWEGFWDRLGTFRGARVKDVMSANDWYHSNPHLAVKKGFSLLHAMEVMVREGVHRVAVLDDRDQVIGISTQSMIISLISQNANLLGPGKELRVSDMHGGLCDGLLAVKDSQRAIDAFRLMAEKRVSGVAVVNDHGALVDVISARDLRCMATDGARWWRLFETIRTFKMLSRLQFPQQTPRRPLYVLENEPFTRVLESMDDGNIHRVIEVKGITKEASSSEMEASLSGAASGTITSAYQPIHVISQRDTIRFVLKLFGTPVGSGKCPLHVGAAAAASPSPSSSSSSSSSPLPSISTGSGGMDPVVPPLS